MFVVGLHVSVDPVCLQVSSCRHCLTGKEQELRML